MIFATHKKASNNEMKGIVSYGNLHGNHSRRQAPGVVVKQMLYALIILLIKFGWCGNCFFLDFFVISAKLELPGAISSADLMLPILYRTPKNF